MASQEMYDELGKDVERLEQKVQEVYYLGQFEKAAGFKNRLFNIEKKLLVLASQSDSYGMQNGDPEIIKEITKLEDEINSFLEGQGKELGKDLESIRFSNSINDRIIQKLGVLPSSELWGALSGIIEEWEKTKHSDLQEQISKKLIRKTVLDILISSSRKGEPIDLSTASNFCSTEDLIEAIQDRLIEIAESQDEKTRINTLGMAKYLQKETLSSVSVWKVLTNNSDVKIKGFSTDQPKKESTENSMALAVVQQKVSFVDRLKKMFHIQVLPKTTIYTFGDINPETGAWENVQYVADKYPKKLSNKQRQRLLAVEINDVDKVERVCYDKSRCLWGHPFAGAENLKRVVFGRVKEIGHYYLSDSPSITSVVFSDNVEVLEYGVCQNCPNLSDVTFGKNIQSIDYLAFQDCVSLEKAIFSDKTKKIGSGTFQNCYKLSSVSMPGVLSLGERCFMNCESLSNLNLGEEILRIERQCFYNCTSLRSLFLPKSLRSIQYEAFQYCEQLSDISFDPGLVSFIFDNDDHTQTIRITSNLLQNLQKISNSTQFRGCKALHEKISKLERQEEERDAKSQENNKTPVEPEIESSPQIEDRDEDER